MSTKYPGAQDDNTTFPNPSTTNNTINPSHAGLHDNTNDAIKAIEAKLGTGASTPSANKVLRGTGAGTTAFGQVDLTADVTGILSVANGGTGTTSTTGTGKVVYDTSPVINSPTVTNPPSNIAIPPSTILAYGGSAAPSGWLLCDGTSYLRTDYSALFAAIGTTYGSVDGAHFNVPDLRGRVPIGVGTAIGANGATAHALGSNGGEETHVLTIPEIPSHTHDVDAYGGGGAAGNKIANQANPGGNVNNPAAAKATGGGGAHNNMQPFLTINYIIKT